uniref:PDZ domain containing 4 n=1 Tax=Strigops habroptila TaxID=2489341 RepID=A0A672U1L4_STRHB
MGCNMCVVQKPEEQHRVMLQVSGKEGPRREPARGGPRGGKEPLVLHVLRRSPRGRPPPTAGAPPWGGPGPPPPPGPTAGLVDSGTQTDISFGGAEPPPLPHDYFDPTDLGDPERPEELEYEEVELYKASHRDKLGLTVCYRTDGEEDAGIYVGEVNPNSIAAKDGRIREGDRIIQINGVEVQDREEAVAFLTQEQQTNISLLLARPESQRWKDSDREDFLDDFGSDEDGDVRQRRPWSPPGQPPSPATPCPRGAEPDSGVGRTDESTRNEESSEHDPRGEEGDGTPPRPAPRRPPPARPGPGPAPGPAPAAGGSPRGRAGPAGRPGAGSGSGLSPGGRPGSGSSSGSGAGRGSGGRAGAGSGPGLLPVVRAGSAARPGAGCAAVAAPPGAGLSAGGARGAASPGGSPVAGPLGPAELRRYRQLRGRRGAAGPGGGAELALLGEELRLLELRCRQLLRAQAAERLRERGLADISEAPERDSTSAYNTGESCRSSPPPRGWAGAGAGAGAARGAGPRGKRPGRDRLLKARAIKILEERGGSTTDDDARSELKTGRYWSREQRKQHLARAREQRRRRELLLQGRAEPPLPGAGAPEPPPPGAAARRGPRKRSRRILDNWVTIQEMLARSEGGRGGGEPAALGHHRVKRGLPPPFNTPPPETGVREGTSPPIVLGGPRSSWGADGATAGNRLPPPRNPLISLHGGGLVLPDPPPSTKGAERPFPPSLSVNVKFWVFIVFFNRPPHGDTFSPPFPPPPPNLRCSPPPCPAPPPLSVCTAPGGGGAALGIKQSLVFTHFTPIVQPRLCGSPPNPSPPPPKTRPMQRGRGPIDLYLCRDPPKTPPPGPPECWRCPPARQGALWQVGTCTQRAPSLAVRPPPGGARCWEVPWGGFQGVPRGVFWGAGGGGLRPRAAPASGPGAPCTGHT